MGMVFSEDKRTMPEFPENGTIWCQRKSEKKWHYCKYCGHNVPTFKFTEGVIGSLEPVSILRCCWECGAGIEVIMRLDHDGIERISAADRLR